MKKRKIKRFDEGGVLKDRYGNAVKSGSGEDVRTRYGSEPKSETVDDIQDYASLGRRAGATSPFTKVDVKEEISEPVSSKAGADEEESTAGTGARNLALEEKSEKVTAKKAVKAPATKKPKSINVSGASGFGIDEKSIAQRRMEGLKTSKSSGFGPKNTFLTKERLERSKEAMRGMKSGGKVSSASSRADGIAQRGKTRGKVY